MTLGSHTSRKPFQMLDGLLTATYERTNQGKTPRPEDKAKHLTKAPTKNFEEKIMLTAPYEHTA